MEIIKTDIAQYLSNKKRGLEKGVSFTSEWKPLQLKWKEWQKNAKFDSFAGGKR